MSPNKLSVDLEGHTFKKLKELVKDPTTPPQVLHQIYWMFKDWTICADIAENPNVTSATLQLIAGDEDPWIRAAAAESSKCTPDLLHRFATDVSYTVRNRVWRNPNTNEEDLVMIKAMRWIEKQ